MITAWEYITGIPREIIAKDIGHEGSVYEEEILWWAATHNFCPVPIKTRECLTQELGKMNPPGSLDTNSRLLTREALYTYIQDKLAVVSVPTPGSNIEDFCIHAVAWFGKEYLDPLRTLPRLGPHNIQMATILHGEDWRARIEAIRNGNALIHVESQ